MYSLQLIQSFSIQPSNCPDIHGSKCVLLGSTQACHSSKFVTKNPLMQAFVFDGNKMTGMVDCPWFVIVARIFCDCVQRRMITWFTSTIGRNGRSTWSSPAPSRHVGFGRYRQDDCLLSAHSDQLKGPPLSCGAHSSYIRTRRKRFPRSVVE